MAESLSRFWWVKLPLASRRLSRGLLAILLDGLYLMVWPPVAALTTPLVVVAGFLLGWLHPGSDLTTQSPEAFSQSLAVLVLAVVVGAFSGHLGAGFLVGYAVGDFFLANTGWNVLEVRIPLLITYALLALPAIFFPCLSRLWS